MEIVYFTAERERERVCVCVCEEKIERLLCHRKRGVKEERISERFVQTKSK